MATEQRFWVAYRDGSGLAGDGEILVAEFVTRLIAAAPEMFMLVEEIARANASGIGRGAIENWCREARELMRKITGES